MPSVDPVSTGIGIATSLAQTISGIVNNGKAKREAKRLEASRPKYSISNLVGQDLDQAESEAASGGISARAERAYNNLNDKQFSSSLDAILKGGGSVNNVSEIFGQNDEGRQRLALLSDQMRLGQIDRLSRARQSMVNEEDKAFLYNIDAPWKDAAQANAESRKQAQTDIWGGVKTAAGIAMQAGATAFNNKRYDDYFNDGSSGGNSGRPATARTTYYTDKPSEDYSDFQSTWG